MHFKDILNDLLKFQVVSITGLEKNVGKTTTLNAIIKIIEKSHIYGLTSIGRDGESIDIVTNTHKPRIYVDRNTLIATAQGSFQNCDVTKEIIASMGITTPLGDIIIFRCNSDGFVEIAGPSQTKQIERVCEMMISFGAEIVLVDGALSRKSFASPKITNATILCTGASVSPDIDESVNITKHAFRLLSWEQEKNDEILYLTNKVKVVGFIFKDKTVFSLDCETSLDSEENVVLFLKSHKDQVEYIIVKGIFSDSFINNLMNMTEIYKNITFLVEDGTKLFISPNTLYKFEKTGGNLKTINSITILCITVNPTSPSGILFNSDQFISKLSQEIPISIFNVQKEILI